jgi:tetratricopeptide (TPR) repeat protein
MIAQEDQRRRVAGICLALAAVTFAVFGQTLQHEFVGLDDNEYVYENPVVARGLTFKGSIWAFTHVHSSNWHPLTWLSHMLDCQLYGLHPGGHHLTNVLLHIATVIALFLVLRQMTGTLWRSAFVAAVFAIHPLRVESVAWVAERKDVLSGLFFMLTIGAYARYARHARETLSPPCGERAGRGACYGLVVLLFAMGLMCKPMLVTLPLVLLLLDYWPLQRKETAGKLALEKLPLLALSAASCAVTLLAQGRAIQSIKSFSPPVRFGNALIACKVYLDQMVHPAGLAVFYPFPHVLSARRVALAGIVLAGFSIVAWVWRRKQPWLITGWLWYLVMLLPVVGIIQVGAQAHADRYTYLPQIGIYVALTWLVAEWSAKWGAGWLHDGPLRVALAVFMTGVIAVLMVCAWRQTAYWQNSEVLSTRALACTTDNDFAHFILGNTLLDKGNVDKAINQFELALQINPAFVKARINLGNALLQEGKVDEAVAHYQEALKNQPDLAVGHFNLGNALLQKGSVDEAINQFHRALEINPGYAEVRNNLGRTLCQKGRVDEGIIQFEQALQINPAFVDARNNLGNAFMEKGRVDEAIACYKKVLALDPGYEAAWRNLERAVLKRIKN